MGSGASKNGKAPRPTGLEPPPGEHDRSSSAASNSQASRSSSRSSDNSGQHTPPPFPSTKSKSDIYDQSKYNDVDKHAVETPKRLLKGSFKDLLDHLIKGSWTPTAKLRAIFRWLTSIDVYNMTIEASPPTHSPIEYFQKIQKSTGNHAHLFSGLCQMVGIPCYIISGMNKSAAYEIGKDMNRKAMGAQWNAVYIDDEWRLVDAFWACACVVGKKTGEWKLVDTDGQVEDDDQEEDEGFTQHRINEFYFLTDPEKLIWTHLPDDSQWQLLKHTVSQKEFGDHFYLREKFHYLGMQTTPDSQMKCVLTTKRGETSIEFCLPSDRSKKFSFKYMLYLSRSSMESNKANVFLDRFIYFEQRPDQLVLALRFPIKGTFKLDLFGVDTTDSDIFDLVCTYLIQCPEHKTKCLPLPDVPPLGWGPVLATEQAGLTPKTHQAGIIKTKDGNIEIRFGVDRELQVHHALLHAVIDQADLNNYSVTRLENGEVIVNVRMPQGGEYALKLYAQEEGDEGIAPNVCNYLIKCEKDNLNNSPFPNVPSGKLGKNYLGDKLGVKASSHPVGSVETKDGRLPMTFEAPENVELMCEIHCVGADGKITKLAVQPKVDSGTWTFDIDLPTAGEYSLNIFAKEKSDDDRIYNVHSYLINSKGRKMGKDENAETLDSTNVPVETVETADNELWIPAPEGYENVVAALHRKNATDPPTINQISFIKQDEQNFIRVKLPEYGDYVLNLYNSQKGGNVLNIARYQINRKLLAELFQTNIQTIMEAVEAGAEDKDSSNIKVDKKGDKRTPSGVSTNSSKESAEENSEEVKKKHAKNHLLKTMELKDADRLEAAIADCEEVHVDDQELLKKAKRLHKLLLAKKALTEASAKRDLKLLEDAIKNARNVNFGHMLDLQIAMAAKLRKQLARIEKLRHQVLSMDQKTIAEIKHYSSPPDGIFQTMQGTFMLLGHRKREVKEWRLVQVLLGKTGKESIMRKISQFDPQTVYLDHAQNAGEKIKPYSLDQIREKSAGAATFYVWSTGMIEEVESTGGAGMSPKALKNKNK